MQEATCGKARPSMAAMVCHTGPSAAAKTVVDNLGSVIVGNYLWHNSTDTHVHACIHRDMDMHACTHTTHTYIHTYTHIHTHTHTHACMHAHTHTHTHTHTHAHTHTHTHTHKHTQTHMYRIFIQLQSK